MHYDRIVFIKQYPIVDRFVQHLVYCRALTNAYREHRLRSQFWYVTVEAHLFAATINWCMVFGSHGCNPTHWKKLSVNEQEYLIQSFRDGLFKELSLDQLAWEEYQSSIREFRDNFVAHRNLEFSKPIPIFDTALTVAFYYDEWIRTIISPDTLAERSLTAIARDLEKSAALLVEKLLNCTEDSLVERLKKK
jgi:hypothetical protein